MRQTKQNDAFAAHATLEGARAYRTKLADQSRDMSSEEYERRDMRLRAVSAKQAEEKSRDEFEGSLVALLEERATHEDVGETASTLAALGLLVLRRLGELEEHVEAISRRVCDEE